MLNKLRSIKNRNIKEKKEKEEARKKEYEEKKEKLRKEEEEKRKKEYEEEILNIGYYLLAEMSYYDMSKSEQEKLQGHSKYNISNINKIKKENLNWLTSKYNFNDKNNIKKVSPWLQSHLPFFIHGRAQLIYNINIKNNKENLIELYKDYNVINKLYKELKTKGELNDEAIELGTESIDNFDRHLLIRRKYEKKEQEEKTRKNEEEKERKNKEVEEKKKKEESRLNDETEKKAEAYVKENLDYLIGHIHTHIKNKRDMNGWSIRATNPRLWITGPYEGTYAVRQGLKKYEEEWEKYYKTLD